MFYNTRRTMMLYWALVFFLIDAVAAVLAFGGIAHAGANIARIVFFLFLAIFVASLVAALRIPRNHDPF